MSNTESKYAYAVTKEVERLKDVAKEEWGLEMGSISISYPLKGRSTLGTAKKTRAGYEMLLHLPLLEEFGRTYIDEVVVHEFAHLVVYARRARGDFGAKRVMPHGREFKDACRVFGIVGKSKTTAFNSSKIFTEEDGAGKKRYFYTCGCGRRDIGVRRHRRILRHGVSYKCAVCDQRLTPTEKLGW